MRNRVLYIWMICFGVLTSCGDFLEDYSQDLTYASSVADLDELLIGNGYMLEPESATAFQYVGENAYFFPWIHLMDDDTEEPDRKQQQNTTVQDQLVNFHTWQKNPFQFQGEPYDDPTWKDLYERIAVMNVVIPKVDEMVDDLESERNRIKGEAFFLRGSYYYLLANFYGLPYSVASASTDLSVPLKLSEYVEDKYFSRNTVQEVYEAIANDLEQAAELLDGVEQTTVYQANEAAARLLLSRVYLYMERWDDAIAQCDSIIAMDSAGIIDRIEIDRIHAKAPQIRQLLLNPRKIPIVEIEASCLCKRTRN